MLSSPGSDTNELGGLGQVSSPLWASAFLPLWWRVIIRHNLQSLPAQHCDMVNKTSSFRLSLFFMPTGLSHRFREAGTRSRGSGKSQWYVKGILCLSSASLTLQPHLKEHDGFSTGIQPRTMTELWDEDDLAPEKLYLPPEITTFTGRVERMFPGH